MKRKKRKKTNNKCNDVKWSLNCRQMSERGPPSLPRHGEAPRRAGALRSPLARPLRQGPGGCKLTVSGCFPGLPLSRSGPSEAGEEDAEEELLGLLLEPLPLPALSCVSTLMSLLM